MAFEIRGITPLLGVYDMPTAVRFYRDKLGFEVVSTSPVLGDDYFHWVLLRRGDAEIMLNTNFEFNDERPALIDQHRNGVHSDTTLYLSCSDVDAAYEESLGRGVDVKPPVVAHYGMKQMYFLDPDGYGICFQWPAQ